MRFPRSRSRAARPSGSTRVTVASQPTSPGPFVPPTPPVDATNALKAELEELRKRVHASSDEVAKALLAFRDAEDARLRAISEAEAHREDKEFWQSYAAETEAGLRKTEAALRASQAAAESTPPLQLDLLAQ